MKIASIQFDSSDRSKEENIERAANLIDRARGANLILLPELWNIGYFSFDKYYEKAETSEGATLSMVRSKAVDHGAYILSGSIVEREGSAFYNTNYLIDPAGKVLGKYRKIHLFGLDSKEPQLLSPGKEICTVKTNFGVFGLATCYDLRFPELFRAALDQSAGAFLVSSVWPIARLEDWLLLNKVRALENQSFLISSSAVGTTHGNRFAGHSMIVNPYGKVIAQGSESEEIVTAEISMEDVSKARKNFPSVADRRIKG